MANRKLGHEEKRPPGDGLISLAEEGLETGLLPDGWREAAHEAWKGEVQEELLSLVGEGVLQAEVTRAISGWFRHGDSPALEDEQGLFVTAGRGRALVLLANVLLKPGEKVLVETPVSPAARGIFHRNGVEIIGVPCDPDGMLPGECRTLIRKHKPRLIYFTPDESDTCGISWSSRRRAEVLEVALENEVWTVADRSGGRAPVPGEESYLKGSIYAQALERGAGARTAELDSMDGHGIHAAWVRADRALVQRLQEARLKLPEQAGHSGLPGAPAALLVRPGFSWPQHAAALNREYASRRAEALALLEGSPILRAAFQQPAGSGRFLWGELPAGLDSGALLRAARLHGAAFLPGAPWCYAGAGSPRTLRLSLAAQSRQRMRLGLARLADAAAEFTARWEG